MTAKGYYIWNANLQVNLRAIRKDVCANSLWLRGDEKLESLYSTKMYMSRARSINRILGLEDPRLQRVAVLCQGARSHLFCP